MSHRILLVEDDRLIQDMVSGILTAHGHRVDAWEDGVSGVEALCRGGYDLALIDYHLPEIDGYASARLVGSIVPEDRRPKLVAITADPGSLADRERSITAFDAVLAKPFDPDALCRLIERLMQNSGSDAASRASRALWAERGLASRPRCYPVPEPTVEQGLAIDKCFDRAPDPGSADVLLLLDGGCLPELAAARRSGGHLLPAVDLTGERARELDCVFRPDARDTWSKVAESIAGFRRRAAELSPTVRDARDGDAKLLATLYVSGRDLRPVPDAGDPRFFVFAGGLDQAGVDDTADRLVARGLLSKTFVDRFHVCGCCGSHRLNAREECASCRSPDLRETALLHHFRCARVGPEDEFKNGSRLACPKCRGELAHYGSDYERAGTALSCNGCGAMNTDPAVGFVCVDCGDHADGDRIETRDAFAYALTARAIRMLTQPGETVIGLPTLPQAVARAVERRKADDATSGRLLVAELRFGAAEKLIASLGWTPFQTLRRLFIQNLANLLGEAAEVVSDGGSDFVLFVDVSAGELGDTEQLIFGRCEDLLAHRLDARFDVREAA